MKIERYDIVVIGAGPAGLRAAQVAVEEGARVALIDDNPRAGGQIWRQGPGVVPPEPLAHWLADTAPRANLTSMHGTKVIAALGGQRLLLESGDAPAGIEYTQLILATGARERLLPFEGWTLPGVTGAGGLQALLKGGVPVDGERVVIAGSGPLLLAAASTARRRGADVRAVVEQAASHRVMRFGASLAATPGKLAQALSLLREIGWIALSDRRGRREGARHEARRSGHHPRGRARTMYRCRARRVRLRARAERDARRGARLRARFARCDPRR